MNQIETLLPGVEKDVSLAPYTTFQIGGNASYFFIAATKEDVRRAFLAAREAQAPLLILSGGSNMLISDKGFPGLVILMQTEVYNLQSTTLYAEAGVSIETLVQETVERGLAGFEWAGGLPGSLGGAVRGNAGAFGGEIKDSISSVEFLNDKGEVSVLKKEECAFEYRSSIFKGQGWIVLSATFDLQEGDAEKLRREAEEHIRYRHERHPLEYPNAGSVFKNVPFETFPSAWKEAVQDHVKQDPFPVVPAAYLISEAELKGKRIGNVAVSEKHPNYMVNLGTASSEDVLKLISFVKNEIKKKYHIDLEQEIQYVE